MAFQPGVRVSILGTASVEVDGVRCHLPAPKQRALISLLALRANERVSMDGIVDALWGDDVPAAAVSTVRSYIADLRRVLEPERARHGAPGVLVTAPGGYTLRVDPDDVDAGRLEGAVRRASEELHLLGDPWRPAVGADHRQRAAELARSLGQALELWRGDPLADLGDHADIEGERDRLRSLRLHGQVMRMGALVGLHRHAAAVIDLERLCRANPWHEHLWALRALALTGCGRRVEALAHLRELRCVLGDQLGIDPDPQISRLETDLIRQDVSTRSIASVAVHRRAPSVMVASRGGAWQHARRSAG